jgi:hypothetical protein
MMPMEKTHLPTHANRRRVSSSREKHVVVLGESIWFIAPRLSISYLLNLHFRQST